MLLTSLVEAPPQMLGYLYSSFVFPFLRQYQQTLSINKPLPGLLPKLNDDFSSPGGSSSVKVGVTGTPGSGDCQWRWQLRCFHFPIPMSPTRGKDRGRRLTNFDEGLVTVAARVAPTAPVALFPAILSSGKGQGTIRSPQTSSVVNLGQGIVFLGWCSLDTATTPPPPSHAFFF
ncbi:unnamed protein product [Lactuca saligna]|uniref:Uncharacterized protein n=1 Tax=Lactuca saligna TaxID=75948 RepID=A0AA36DZN3_LACSI|nr:unnamed protein product [Lactuca saligna]